MPEPHPITELQIVGYATELADTMLPAVVPPVFRVKEDPSRILIPPFTLSDGMLYGANTMNPPILEALQSGGEVTLLDEPIDARPDHELWVGLDRQVHYEPVRHASSQLRQIAMEQVRLATEALRAGDLDEAENHCRRALCADERLMESLAISAAIARRKNQKGQEHLMGKLAEGYLTSTGFAHLVDGYAGQMKNAPAPAADLFAGHPMAGIAAIPPEGNAAAA